MLGVMVMVHASAARYLWPDPFKLPLCSQPPICPRVHNLVERCSSGTTCPRYLFFFACVGFGPTFKESVFAPLANSGNSAKLVSHVFFFFLVRKISYKFNFLIRFKHITSVVFKNNDNVMR